MNTARYRPLLLIFLTAGSMVIGAKLNFMLGGSTITLQTFFLCLTALFFSPREVFFGQILYLLSGFFAPVFASDYLGAVVFMGSSAGYLYAFPFAAFVLAKYGKGGDWFHSMSWTIMAHFVILVSGCLWLILYTGMDKNMAFVQGFLTLLPGAFIKGGAATLCLILGEKFIQKKK